MFFQYEELHILVFIGLIFVLSQAAGWLAKKAGVPRIAGYLLTGVLIGPAGINILSAKLINEELYLIKHISLAFIAFSIGEFLRMDKLAGLKRVIPAMTVLQGVFSFVFVTAFALLFFFLLNMYDPASNYTYNEYMPVALFLGAINIASAPAVILALIKEYNAQGSLTTLLLGIIGLNDAITILAFSFVMNFNNSLISGDPATFVNMVIDPLVHIGASIAIGAICACILWFFEIYFLSSSTAFGLSIGSVFLTAGITLSLDGSLIITLMTFGFINANYNQHNDTLFQVVENIEEPIFGMFFLLAGAHIRIDALAGVALFAILITLARFTGKYTGCYLGGHIFQDFHHLRHHLGPALMPQAGVAIALVFEARHVIPDPRLSDLMVSIILASTVINEFLSPFLVRKVLSSAGEIRL